MYIHMHRQAKNTMPPAAHRVGSRGIKNNQTDLAIRQYTVFLVDSAEASPDITVEQRHHLLYTDLETNTTN